MSRIGKVPIPIPSGVQITISPEMTATVKGPKGEMQVPTLGNVTLKIEDGNLLVLRHSDNQQDRAFHGLYHRLITNAITGVTEGYRKNLEMIGVGYRAEMKGATLVMSVGRSHQEFFEAPAGVAVATPAQTAISVTGIEKEKVHQAAAAIRSICPPEPYKGKGIRYRGEKVRRKVGKASAK